MRLTELGVTEQMVGHFVAQAIYISEPTYMCMHMSCIRYPSK